MTDQILERVLRHKWSFLTRTRYFERHGVLPIMRREGSIVYDVDGREYIDGHASLCLVNVGYGRCEIVKG